MTGVALVGAAIWTMTSVVGGPRGSSDSSAHARTSVSPSTTTSTSTTSTSTTATLDPGTLPQTDTFPSADAPQFKAELSALWKGIVTNSVPIAMPAFFPEPAYVQLKTVGNPRGDYTGRLVAAYGTDIAAAHAQLGPGAPGAHLMGIDVDSSYAHWVPPGVCDNSVGYYEVPNSRIVYQEGDQTMSFGIASMISWRGQWYVVHLGAVLRSSDQGIVDDPEQGSGTPTYSSTC